MLTGTFESKLIVMMTKTTKLLSIILCFLALYTTAQNTLIKGKLVSKKGEAIIGANIYLKDTYDGTSSNSKGKFLFTTSETGEQTLLISAIGYGNMEKVVVCKGETIELVLELKTGIDVLSAVTITAGAMEASDEKRSVVFKPLDIVTTAGALGSIEGALATLPGTATVGSDGRLFVRGGDASETAIFFDGLRVGNAYGTSTSGVPTRSRFNPILFKGTFFSTGGYSAEYGQALSSALVLNTNDMPIRNQTDINLMTVGAGLSHTQVGEKQSITASLNYTDLAAYQAIVPQDFDWERAPYNVSSEILYRNKINKNGLLKAFYSYQNSGLDIWQQQPGNEGRGSNVNIGNQYHYANVSLKQKFSKKVLFDGGIGFSNNKDEFSLDTVNIERLTSLIHTKAKVNYFVSDRFKIATGAEVISHIYSEELVDQNAKREYTDHLTAAFAEADYYFSEQLILRAGLRSEYSTLNGNTTLTPRLSAAYQFSKASQVSLAYGDFYQAQAKERRITNNDLEDAQATHYLVNYQFSKQGYTFRAEAFYKDYDDLLRIQNGDFTTNGNGVAKGFDLFYRDYKTFQGWDYWLTYSFTDSKRIYNQYQTQIQPSFAPKHNASIVAKRFINKLKSQVGGSWSWNDGLTYDNPNLAGEQESKAKAFSNLSLSWSYLPKPSLIIHFACTNVLGRDNIFGYRYSANTNSAGNYSSLPVMQGAKRFFFVGVFITLSKDKTANQLNNL